MKSSFRKSIAENKVGTITKTYGKTSAIIWNSKRRYKQ